VKSFHDDESKNAIRKIQSEVKELGISQRKFAELSHVSVNTMAKIFQLQADPQLSTYLRMKKTLEKLKVS
jgi:predicted transcriptional regulator